MQYDTIKGQDNRLATNVNIITAQISSYTNRVYVNVAVNPQSHTTLKFLLDSGADISLIKEQDVSSHFPKQEIKLLNKEDINVNAANGSDIGIIGVINVMLKIDSLQKQQTLFVSSNITENIMGLDAINNYNMSVGAGGYFINGKKPISPPIHFLPEHKVLSVDISQDVLITKRHGMIDAFQAKDVLTHVSRNNQKCETIMVDPVRYSPAACAIHGNNINTKVSLIRALYHKNDDGNVTVRVYNCTSQAIQIQPNQVIGVFDSLNQEPLEFHKPREKWHDEDLTKIGEGAVPLGKTKDLSTVLEEIDIGAIPNHVKITSPEDIGCFNGFDVPLTLKENAKPPPSRNYTISQDKQVVLSEWIERMLKAEVISRAPPMGEWQTVCFIVPKKTSGQFQIVTDMRGPNTQIESKFPPIKTIGDMIVEAQTANSDVFSVIDIQHAFFSIKYKKGDNEPTTFYADCGNAVSSWGENLSGKYRYERLVMGAQPSSAAFYEVMNFALRGIPSVQIYCDDIFIHTRGNEQHLKVLEQLLSRLQYYGLKIASKKCKLMFSSVVFLGYHISKDELNQRRINSKSLRI